MIGELSGGVNSLFAYKLYYVVAYRVAISAENRALPFG